MKYKYGEVILKTTNRDELLNKIKECISFGYDLGDEPLLKIHSNTQYALIVNSDNYIDVEYFVPVVEYTFITKSEYKRLKESATLKGA